ncbi:hypothetical protein ACTA71_011015 [Dictyostelium dimigraforme]
MNIYIIRFRFSYSSRYISSPNGNYNNLDNSNTTSNSGDDWEKLCGSQCDNNRLQHDDNKIDQLKTALDIVEWDNDESINNTNKVGTINVTGYYNLNVANQQNFINNLNKLISTENNKNPLRSKTFIKRINDLMAYKNSNDFRKHPNNDSNKLITELMLSPIPPDTFTITKKRLYKIVTFTNT